MSYWREYVEPGDLVQTFKDVHGEKNLLDGTFEHVRIPADSLLTVAAVHEGSRILTDWEVRVIYKAEILMVRFLTEAVVNLTRANSKALIGKHFCALSQLSREHPYFGAKIRAYGGGWSNKYTKKCTHVVTRLGDPNAVQYTYARKQAMMDNKKFISEDDLLKMMGL